ncbi:MAG TPA: gamma-glutamylcyclotransferase [Ferruginibacter sp.]|nr:gamma-glutamylcyclotransferase [Ferruginibacter sp.]
MQSPSYQLFVYGSLRSGFRNPAYDYLTQYFHLVGEALVRGKLYDNGAYPVAVNTSADEFITGELYVINNKDEFSWVLGQLDDYEGLNTEANETPLYRRELTEVFINGQGSMAWVYWYNKSIQGMKHIPIGDVLKYLQQKNKP